MLEQAKMDGAKPILDQVNIVAGNFGGSLDFYRRLGVEFPQPVSGRTGDQFHANGKTPNGFRFELDSAPFARVWNQGWAARSDLVGHIVLGFGLASREEVDRVYAQLTEAGHPGLAPPHDAFWGARYAIVEDPNGIAVGLMSPVDPARKTQPPSGWAD
jgi:catechol 2,3-dioxygenase-like lactoylglutathione lyase family enzyme